MTPKLLRTMASCTATRAASPQKRAAHAAYVPAPDASVARTRKRTVVPVTTCMVTSARTPPRTPRTRKAFGMAMMPAPMMALERLNTAEPGFCPAWGWGTPSWFGASPGPPSSTAPSSILPSSFASTPPPSSVIDADGMVMSRASARFDRQRSPGFKSISPRLGFPDGFSRDKSSDLTRC